MHELDHRRVTVSVWVKTWISLSQTTQVEMCENIVNVEGVQFACLAKVYFT